MRIRIDTLLSNDPHPLVKEIKVRNNVTNEVFTIVNKSGYGKIIDKVFMFGDYAMKLIFDDPRIIDYDGLEIKITKDIFKSFFGDDYEFVNRIVPKENELREYQYYYIEPIDILED